MNKIARLILASSEASSDLRYAAGFSAPDEFIWFDADGARGIIVSPLEFNRAREQAKPGVTVYPEAEFGGPGRIEVLRRLAERFTLTGFLVPANFPAYWYERLRECGFQMKAEGGPFFPEREWKVEDEITAVITSQRAAEAAVRRAFRVLEEATIGHDRLLHWEGGLLTSERLRAEIDGELVRRGMLPTGTICAGGAQGAQPHHTGTGPLAADWPIVMDVFPKSIRTGYWGDLTRTVVKGRASDIVKHAYDAVLTARELGKSLVKIGADPAEIHQAAAQLLQQRGFQTGKNDAGDFGFFHGLGHGVGLDIHEAPRLSPRNHTPLRSGEIVTVEPGLYYPEWGGIRLEDLMYLPPSLPALCLSDLDDFLEIS